MIDDLEYNTEREHLIIPEYGRHLQKMINHAKSRETKEERNAYYEDQTRLKKEALDNNMFTESRRDGRYVKYDADRKSNVTFGKK